MKILSNKVAVIADLHIGLHQANHDWHNVSLEFAKWFKKSLLEQDINDIIILGDVLDNRNEVSVQTLHILANFFQILEDFNIIITIGNHDCYYTKRSDVHSLGTLKEHSNIDIVDRLVTINMFNKKLTFCPWNTLIADVPQSDIIFGHFEINSFKMNGNKTCENGIESTEMFQHGSLILSGHFHKTEAREYKTGSIVYVGSPYEQSWGEFSDPKGYYILDINDNSCQFIENNISPKHKRIRLSEMLSGSNLASIKNEIKNNIINFIVDVDATQDIIDKVLAKFYTLGPFSIKTENLLYKQDIIDIETDLVFEGIDIKSDIIGFVNEYDMIDNKDEHIKYLMEVYDACEK